MLLKASIRRLGSFFKDKRGNQHLIVKTLLPKLIDRYSFHYLKAKLNKESANKKRNWYNFIPNSLGTDAILLKTAILFKTRCENEVGK